MDQSEALLARYRSCLAAYSLRSQARMRRCKPTHGLLSTPIDGWITDPPTDDEWGTATLHFRDAVERVFARRIDAVLRVQARIRAVDQKLQAKRRELQAMVFAFAQHRAPVHGASKEEGEEADDEPLASLDPALLAEFERTLAARSEYTSRVDEITLFTSIVKARVPRNDLTQELRNDRHRLSEEHAQTLDCPPEHIRIALDWDDRLLGAEHLVVYCGDDEPLPVDLPIPEMEYRMVAAMCSARVAVLSMHARMQRWHHTNVALAVTRTQADLARALHAGATADVAKDDTFDALFEDMVGQLMEATVEAMAGTGVWTPEHARKLVDGVLDVSEDVTYASLHMQACDYAQEEAALQYERAETRAVTALQRDGLNVQAHLACVTSAGIDLCTALFANGQLPPRMLDPVCQSEPHLRAELERCGLLAPGDPAARFLDCGDHAEERGGGCVRELKTTLARLRTAARARSRISQWQLGAIDVL
tara:strand:+ start:1879 stop:3312 length:1434 start_codon:yes stop_codon:yes gene_type:complete